MKNKKKNLYTPTGSLQHFRWDVSEMTVGSSAPKCSEPVEGAYPIPVEGGRYWEGGRVGEGGISY